MKILYLLHIPIEEYFPLARINYQKILNVMTVKGKSKFQCSVGFIFLLKKNPTDVLVCYFEFVNMNVDVYINAIYNKKYKVLQDKSIITEPIPFKLGVVQPTTSREYDFT